MNELIQARTRTGMAGEAEFLRRRNSKLINKQKRIRAIRIKGLHMFLIFSVLIAAAMLAYKISIFMLTWEKLDIKTFVLIDKPTFKTRELEDILRRFNGNILTLQFSDLRKSLLTFNEVKDVSITRELPSTVEIRFILRKPVFQVAINGKYNIMDTEGVILYTNKTTSNDLISISGIARGELGELVPFLPELSRLKSSIQYVTLKKPYGIVLKMKGKKELFYPGETNFARKINNYLKLRQQPQLSKYNITCVDLRFKDRFYFEYETEVKN